VRDNFSSINLYQADGSHPSLEGTYLAACTFYASAFRKPSVGATYTAGLDASTALKLQMAADLAVLDSLDTWHLRPKDEIAIADFHYVQNGSSVQFINDSWRATDYTWDFGDMTTASFVNGTHTFASSGTYPVQLIAQNECGSDTLIVNVQVTVAGIESLNDDFYKISTSGNGIFQLSFEEAQQLSDVHMFAIDGKELNLNYTQTNDNVVEIDLSSEKAGIYFLNFISGDKRYSQKLYK
jgi:PKD repeat protein